MTVRWIARSALIAVAALTLLMPMNESSARKMNPDDQGEGKAKKAKAKAKVEKAKAKNQKAKAKDAKEPGKDGKHNGKAAGAGGEAAAAPGNHKRVDRLERIKMQAEARKAQRQTRAKMMRNKARMRARGALRGKPMNPALKQEFKRHARRMARLHRINELAAESGDEALVTRVEKLMNKERNRHNRWMSQHARSGDAAGAAAGTPAPEEK